MKIPPNHERIIDGDGHVMEDIPTIWKYMPEEYVGRSFSDIRGRSRFPPIDHLHSAIFNGILDKFPGVRLGFLEAGCAWLLTCLERFTRSWASHVQYDPRGRFLKLREGDTVTDYIIRHINEGRIFIGVEGNEFTVAEAVRLVGNKPFIFSSDYPHEVDVETCKAELEELHENPQLTAEDREAILHKNSIRFYNLAGN